MYAPISSIPPLEHILREELGISHTQASLVFTIPSIMVIALAIPGGLLADRIGVRKAAGIGAIIVMVGSLLRGAATDYASLLAFTVIYGIGVGLSFPNMPKLVSVWVPREKAGIATGIFIAGFSAGIALPVAITVPAVYPITHSLSGTFFIWALPAIAATILWWAQVKDPPHDAKAPASKKMPFQQIIRNKNVWMMAALMLCNNFFIITWVAWTPALMIQKGAEPGVAAYISSLTMWAVIVSVFISPRLSYKLGVRKPFIWMPSFGLAIASLAAVFISVPLGVLLMILAGLINAARFVTIMALPVELISKEAVGRASGLMVSVGYIGATTGPLIGGRLFDLTGSISPAFIVLIGISLATATIGLIIPETGSKPLRQN